MLLLNSVRTGHLLDNFPPEPLSSLARPINMQQIYNTKYEDNYNTQFKDNYDTEYNTKASNLKTCPTT